MKKKRKLNNTLLPGYNNRWLLPISHNWWSTSPEMIIWLRTKSSRVPSSSHLLFCRNWRISEAKEYKTIKIGRMSDIQTARTKYRAVRTTHKCSPVQARRGTSESCWSNRSCFQRACTFPADRKSSCRTSSRSSSWATTLKRKNRLRMQKEKQKQLKSHKHKADLFNKYNH